MAGNKKKKSVIKRKKKNEEWVGKHKVLVKASGRRARSEFFVVDLKENKIEMEHPYKLYSDSKLGSAVVVLEDTIVVFEIGGLQNYNITSTDGIHEDNDYFHRFRSTSTSKLNLKTDPPNWSKWKDCGAETDLYWWRPWCATLGSKIFAFGCHRAGGQVYDTNKNKWDDLTIPSGPAERYYHRPIMTLADPDNNRLILYFDIAHCLYAFYPDKDKEESQWECLVSNMEQFNFNWWSAQLLDDVIYLFESPYTIHAYDIPQRKLLNVLWPEKKLQDYDVDFRPSAKIIHLGDSMMCLVMAFPYGVLKFLRFHVRRVAGEDVQVTPVCLQIFTAADQTSHGRSFFPI